MYEYIIYSLSFLAGMILMGFITIPMYTNSWETGFKEAEKVYSNWDEGYKLGYNDGFREGRRRASYDQ